MRLLLKEYGSYANLPLDVSSNILEIEEYNMTESLRSKNKPIGHLPVSAEFKFIEIDMLNLVSYKTYEIFEKQIRVRENLRKRRIAQEKKYNDKAKLIDEKKHEYYLRTTLEVNPLRKTRLIPEWVANTTATAEDETWFTLDGKEIKSEPKKPYGVWQGNDDEETKERIEEAKEPEAVEDNTEDNMWNEFTIQAQGGIVEEFPALGGPRTQKPDVIPTIISKNGKAKTQNKKQSTKKSIKFKNDDGEKREVFLSEAESQFLASKDDNKFTLDSFIVIDEKDKRQRRKRKGRR